LSAIARGFDLLSILNCFKLNVVFWARMDSDIDWHTLYAKKLTSVMKNNF